MEVRYYKCKNCGKDNLIKVKDIYSINKFQAKCSRCKEKLDYSSEIEEQWINETNEKGERLRIEVKGSYVYECQKRAAEYFKCSIENVEYYIIQEAGAFKRCIIRAWKKKNIEMEDSAIKIEYDYKKWIAIDPINKKILYPERISDIPIRYSKVEDLILINSTPECVSYGLKLDSYSSIILIRFSSRYIKNIEKFISVIYEELPQKEYGIFLKEYIKKAEFSTSFDTVTTYIKGNNISVKGSFMIWREENYLCLCSKYAQLNYRFKIDKIRYFRLIGDKYVTTEISGGNGGGFSAKGAIIGGIIAGDAGAIIGSRKEIEPIKGHSEVHNEQKVLMYDKDLKEVLEFSSSVYDKFTKLIPEKEYDIVLKSDMNENANKAEVNIDALEVLEKLGNLYERGILTKEEFEAKKQKILSRI